MSEGREANGGEVSRRNPFWICLIVLLALAADSGFRFLRSLEQRQQLRQLQLNQAANIGRMATVLAQAPQVEAKLQAVSLDLMQVARTNALAAQLVREFNIQLSPGAATASPAGLNPGADSAEPASNPAATATVPK